jgi:hypothetical protein
MKRFKYAFHKIALSSLGLIIAVGCATVTDANTDPGLEKSSEILTVDCAGDTWDSRNGDALDPIRGDRPDMGE